MRRDDHGGDGLMTWLARSVLACELSLLLATLYQLLLLLLAATKRPELARADLHPAAANGVPASANGQPAGGAAVRFLILIPAHDEAGGIEAMLASVQAVHYPPELVRVVVIADNCSDETAALARAAGAEVLERHSTEQRGKGYALAWATERLLAGRQDFDAVTIVDADCKVSSNLLAATDRRLRAGVPAVQAPYLVDNPLASPATALRFAAFTMLHVVRPLGKERLGLSCGLWGTGMTFDRQLLLRLPWNEVSLAEDGEYHLRLVEAGERVGLARDAWVRSPMPSSAQAAVNQRARWELGKVDLAWRWGPRLIRAGIRHRDPVRLAAAFEQLIPPQSLIAAWTVACALFAAVLRRPRLVALALGTLGVQIAGVIGGLALVRAPGQVYRALLFAPALILRQLRLYLDLARGRGPRGWVRTARD